MTALQVVCGLTADAALEAGEVHVWTLDLDGVTASEERLAAHLSRDELVRAAGFRLELHRRRFLISHAFMRSVLGDYVGRQPASLEFGRAAHGKPLLLGEDGRWTPHFSLSHSGSMAACAVARQPVGVDFEREQAIPEEAGIAARIFSSDRQSRWAAEPAPSRAVSLLVGWTEFEALAKAQGGGLVSPPDPIDLDGGLNSWRPVLDRGRWSVIAFQTTGGSVLSVAIAGGPGRLSVRDWPWTPV